MSSRPKVFVIGWPIKHSRSPLIHGYWLKTLGLPGSYEKIAIEPERLQEFLASLADRGFAGGNVTVPHKEQALALAAEATLTARRIGAANTLWLDAGRLQADNTDAYGFTANLQASAPGWAKRDGRVVVLGAGGAARAIVHGILEAGVEHVVVVNRSLERAEALARDFDRRVMCRAWAERAVALEDASVLVNATSLGMMGQPPLDIDLGRLRAPATVVDIVYVPLETPLLAAARQRGYAVVDGLGMLLHQAVPGFERWFGVKPAVTPELRQIIVRDIEDGRC